MRAGASTLLAAVALMAAVGAGVAVDAFGLDPPEAAGRRFSAPAPDSGAWYCVVGDTADGSILRVVGAVPRVGSTSAALRFDRFREGLSQRLGEVEVFRGDVYTTTPVPAGVESAGVAARWWRTPTVVARVWEVEVAGEAGGVVEGPCETEPDAHWYLPAVTTSGGSRARIALANPFESDAAVSIELLTADGPTAPERLKNVGIPSGTVHVVDLNEYAPERSDLGAIVTVQAGRVVAEGWQSADAAVGGIEGVSLAKLSTSAAETWTIPWFQSDGAESWVTVANVADRSAALNVTVHGADGGAPPEGMEEITVPSGAVHRIPLSGVLPGDAAGGAVTVTSANGVPVVASGTTRVGGQSAERTGISVHLGVPRPASRWLIATAASGERHEVVHLVNPGADPVRVSLEVLGGDETVSPPPLPEVDVPPGAIVDVDITEHVAGAGAHAVAVVADGGPIVAGMHAWSPDGALRLVSHHAVSGDAWTGGHPIPVVNFERGLTRRIDTPFGPQATVAPTPVPTAGGTVGPGTLEPGTLEPLPDPTAEPGTPLPGTPGDVAGTSPSPVPTGTPEG